MPNSFEVRPYRDSDKNDVWIIWHTALGNLTREQVPLMANYQGDDADLLHIKETYLQGEGAFLVGVFEGQVVAICGLIKSSAGRGQIRHMSVDINYHRRGFGKLMMQEMEKRAIELGCTSLYLDTSIGQLPAQALYLSCGFHEVGHSFVGVGNWEIILYEKQIQ